MDWYAPPEMGSSDFEVIDFELVTSRSNALLRNQRI
jgi:hypothetical protein